MKPMEIRRIKEFCWGSLVVIFEDGKEKSLVTVRTCYLGGAFMVVGSFMLLIGLLIGRW